MPVPGQRRETLAVVLVGLLAADSDARLQPGLFDDPIEDTAEAARLDGLLREMTNALADPKFDLDLPVSGDPNGTKLSLRQMHDALAEDADFVDAIKTLCLT